MRRLPILLVLCAGTPALAQSYNNNLNPLGGPAQLQVNMNPNWTPALGDGRGLERDFSGRGLGNYNARDFGTEARIRNNVVSNNAFSSGYGSTAFSANTNRGYNFGNNRFAANTDRSYNLGANQLRGSLSADDLFSYRRDALSSGAASLGVRGTESLQYLYGYSTANKFAIPSAYPTTNPGPGAPQGSPVPTYIPPTFEPTKIPLYTVDDFSGLGNGWSDVAPKFGTLRSTSSFLSNRSLNPSVVGVRNDEYGIAESLTASPMLGLRGTPARRSDRSEPLNVTIDPATGRPVADPATDPAATPAPSNPLDPVQPEPGAKRSGLSTAYDDLLERFAKADGIKPLPDARPDETAPLWKARLQRLREQIDKPAPDAVSGPEAAELTAAQSAEKRRQSPLKVILSIAPGGKQGAFHQPFRAFADQWNKCLDGERSQAPGGEHLIGGEGNVGNAIDEGSVEIENDDLDHTHCLSFCV